MYARTRQKVGQLRALGAPRSLRVETGASGAPVVVFLDGKPRRVTDVREIWRIDDEWWRRPIVRTYFALTLENGRPVTIYYDATERRWYAH
jgi:hypothetical protein